ncbi:MAG TPA: hypothetical protein VFQ38_14900 [Longimicrobiales bacterium]|nr:hypothetical protein [Longimicrobiales bacterium]
MRASIARGWVPERSRPSAASASVGSIRSARRVGTTHASMHTLI